MPYSRASACCTSRSTGRPDAFVYARSNRLQALASFLRNAASQRFASFLRLSRVVAGVSWRGIETFLPLSPRFRLARGRNERSLNYGPNLGWELAPLPRT